MRTADAIVVTGNAAHRSLDLDEAPKRARDSYNEFDQHVELETFQSHRLTGQSGDERTGGSSQSIDLPSSALAWRSLIRSSASDSASRRQERRDADAELRVVTTLTSEQANDEGLIPAPDVAPFAPGLGSTRWHVPVDVVWPAGGESTLPVPAGAARDDVAAFCRRFVVEADAMPMSGALADPGDLELALVSQLRDEAGVEQYPNRADAVNVASRLLEIASSLRTRTERRLEFGAVARECGLRVDRGRVAQSFPLDRCRYVPRVPLRDALTAAIEEDHRRIVVQGPPGAGKSWALEALAQDLRADGWIVARHYCFLAPGDPEVAQRVAVEAMTANLTAELVDDPRLADVRVGLGGDLGALELLLERAHAALHQETDRIVMIVDGLDHAARIEPPSGTPPVTPRTSPRSSACSSSPTASRSSSARSPARTCRRCSTAAPISSVRPRFSSATRPRCWGAADR